MAETYERAILDFGSVDLVCILALLCTQPNFLPFELPPRGTFKPIGTLKKVIVWIAPYYVGIVFLLTVVASAYNLRLATEFCFPGDAALQQAHLHAKIPLAKASEPWNFSKLHASPWD